MLKLSYKELKILGVLYCIAAIISCFYYFVIEGQEVRQPFMLCISLFHTFAKWCIFYLIFRAIYKFFRALYNAVIRKLKGGSFYE